MYYFGQYFFGVSYNFSPYGWNLYVFFVIVFKILHGWSSSVAVLQWGSCSHNKKKIN